MHRGGTQFLLQARTGNAVATSSGPIEITAPVTATGSSATAGTGRAVLLHGPNGGTPIAAF